MSKDPAVLFYTSDFLAGTSFFTMEQRGQYITLLCQQHQQGSIPENHMIFICGSLDSPVINKFQRDENGNYYNVRMREEAVKRANYCKSRGKNKKGKVKKSHISKSYDNSYENHMSVHMENENENENINDNYLIQKEKLTTTSGIHEKFASTLKISVDQIQRFIGLYFEEIEAKGIFHNSFPEYQSHCFAWIKKNKDELMKKIHNEQPKRFKTTWSK